MEGQGFRQLALDLPHAESFRRDDFLPSPSNEPALALIEAWPNWPDNFATIVGPAGAGKSHLAAIWAERSGARIADAALLLKPEVPRALVTNALVIEDVAPARVDEAALFHLLNLAREYSAYILITAKKRTDLEGFALADLASRLRAIPIVQLAPPDDALIAAVLVKLFADRQILVDEETIAFISSRIERSLSATRTIVADLDEAALARGRRLNRALAAELLQGQKTLF